MKDTTTRGRPVKIWTKQRVQRLRTLRPSHNDNLVAKEMKATISSIRNAAFIFKVKKKNWYWDFSEEQFILKNWTAMTAKEIGAYLKRSRWAVINKYRELSGNR